MHLSRNLELIESRLSADERRPIIEIHSAAVTDRTNFVPFGEEIVLSVEPALYSYHTY